MPKASTTLDEAGRHHANNIRNMIEDVARHAREDVDKVENPKLQALFETTAEVLGGLAQAYDHAEQQSESAWR
jgi:hypothetical protein